MSACNCCTAPPADPSSLCVQTWSSSKSKTGCPACNAGKLYTGRGTSNECLYTSSKNLNCCTGIRDPDTLAYCLKRVFTASLCTFYEGSPSGGGSAAMTITDTVTDATTCATNRVYSGSWSVSFLQPYSGGEGCPDSTTTYSGGGTINSSGGWDGSITVTNTWGACDGNPGGSNTHEVYATDYTPFYWDYVPDSVPTDVFSNFVTVPDTTETTESLIERTIAALPETPSTAGCGSQEYSSHASLSSNENDYSITKIKVRNKHEPTGTCYLKVWLSDAQTLTGGDTTISDDVVGPYIWEGSGNPCLTHPDALHTDGVNGISGPWYDLDYSTVTTGEEITISRYVRKYSFVPGYEPDDPNADRSRPCPDPRGNGFPTPANTVPGCTNRCCAEYDPLATCNDGSCGTERYGCTNPCDSNYDPTALCYAPGICSGDNALCGGWH